VVGRAIDNRGSPSNLIARDFLGALRSLPADPGAVTNRVALQSPNAQIGLATGGSQQLMFDAPALAGASYHVLGSVTGTTPGAVLGGFMLPLNVDSWLVATLQSPNQGVLQNTLGTIDAAGLATATLQLPPLPAALHGLVLQHCLVALQGASIAFVSNPVSLSLQ